MWMRRCAGWSGVVVLLACGMVQAQAQGGDCWGLALPADGPAKLLQVSAAQPRLHFVKNHADDARCPSTAAECRRKAYLVASDRVVVAAATDDGRFVCAGYVGKAGRLTSGWLMVDALDAADVADPVVADWAGQWRRDDEAELQIEALAGGLIAVSGDATWGAGDPERVERGGVHIGQIEHTELAVTAAVLHLESGVGAVRPEHADEYSCVLSLQRIGEVLLARDSGHCGGMNVRFDGVYLRQ